MIRKRLLLITAIIMAVNVLIQTSVVTFSQGQTLNNDYTVILESVVNMETTSRGTITFDVDKNYGSLVLELVWDSSDTTGSPEFKINNPDESEYVLEEIDVANLDSDGNYAINEDEGWAIIFVTPDEGKDTIETGEYTLEYDKIDTFNISVKNLNSLFEITKFDVAQTQPGKYSVEWDTNVNYEVTPSAVISFHLTDEKGSFVGTKVKELIIDGEVAKSFELDLSNIEELNGENYWLYATLSKPSRAPIQLESEVPMTFVNPNIPSSPILSTVSTGNGIISATWNVTDSEITEYVLGVRDSEGNFDFDKEFTTILVDKTTDTLTGEIYGLATDTEYDVVLLAVKTSGESDVKYFSRPSEAVHVTLDKPVTPKIQVEMIGVEGTIVETSVNKNLTEYISDTALVNLSIDNNAGHEFTVIVNGVKEEPSVSTEKSNLVVLNESLNSIYIQVKNANGDTETYQYDIVVDTIDPFLDITAPHDDVITSDSMVRVKGSIEAGNILIINGTNMMAQVNESGQFDINVPVELGKSNIVVQSVDKAGNKSEKSLKVIRTLVGEIESFAINFADTN